MQLTFHFCHSHETKSLRYHPFKPPYPAHLLTFSWQIIPASYNNEAKRIKIPGVPEDIIPPSPEGLKIPAPPSGWTTPIPSIGSPALRGQSMPERGHRTPEGYKTPEDSGELSIRIHDVV